MTYAFHPAADLFPLMDEASEAFIDLVQDIKANGLLTPIELLDQQILDGRNRYRACTAAGVEPRFEQWAGDSPYEHVISRNLHRRHLDPDQRAVIGALAAPKLEEEARKRQARHDGSVEVNSPQLKPEPNATRRKLAKDFDTTTHKIKQAKTIANNEPELLKEVMQGTTTLHEAEKKVRAPRAPRQNGIDPKHMMPGQWIEKPATKAPVTLGTRLLDAINTGRDLPKLTAEVQDNDLDLDDRTVRTLIDRLKTEARVRTQLSNALNGLLTRRKST